MTTQQQKLHKSLRETIVWWGPEQKNKNPLKEYIPLASHLNRSEALETAYQFLVKHKQMTPYRYNSIQAARLFFHDHGECPPDFNDYLHGDDDDDD